MTTSPFFKYNCNYTTLILLHNYNSTTPQLQLQLRYARLHPAVVGGVTDQVTTATIVTLPKAQLQPLFGPSVDSLCHPCITTTRFSYGVLSLKLPPYYIKLQCIYIHNFYIYVYDLCKTGPCQPRFLFCSLLGCFIPGVPFQKYIDMNSLRARKPLILEQPGLNHCLTIQIKYLTYVYIIATIKSIIMV